MRGTKSILLFVFAIISANTYATTWDEPWADKVIKEAGSFVLAKVITFDENTGATIEILKTLGGEQLKGEIKITGFYLLDLCSRSGGHGPEFEFGHVKEAYFFLKKNDKGEYNIATPTAGFDIVKDGNVYGAYRHSYHQALVPVEVYEKTMTAIFNNYHNLPYDKEYINEYVNKYLSLKPAGFSEAEINTFYVQHVALECCFHFRLAGYYSKIIPFLNDTSNFHNQVSAARALIAYNTEECKQELLKVISDTTRSDFVQVICIWTLTDFNPKELKQALLKINETASTGENGFGGNIMDPRICTYFPNIKEAIEKLIEIL